MEYESEWLIDGLLVLVDVLEVGLCAHRLRDFVEIELFFTVKYGEFALVSNRVLLDFGDEVPI